MHSEHMPLSVTNGLSAAPNKITEEFHDWYLGGGGVVSEELFHFSGRS
jgi:hypothetical protein